MWKHVPVVVALLLPIGAWAQDDPFAILDSNGDDAVSQEEAQADEMVAQNFGTADSNQDGNLSREEYDAAFGNQG